RSHPGKAGGQQGHRGRLGHRLLRDADAAIGRTVVHVLQEGHVVAAVSLEPTPTQTATATGVEGNTEADGHRGVQVTLRLGAVDADRIGVSDRGVPVVGATEVAQRNKDKYAAALIVNRLALRAARRGLGVADNGEPRIAERGVDGERGDILANQVPGTVEGGERTGPPQEEAVGRDSVDVDEAQVRAEVAPGGRTTATA